MSFREFSFFFSLSFDQFTHLFSPIKNCPIKLRPAKYRLRLDATGSWRNERLVLTYDQERQTNIAEILLVADVPRSIDQDNREQVRIVSKVLLVKVTPDR